MITGKIKVKSIEFKSDQFRKLKNLKINFADRINLIAGHNGIGKSTILGLVTNTFGMARSKHSTYFKDKFFCNIEKIVYLSVEEVNQAQTDPNQNPIVTAQINDSLIQKRCSMTIRTEERRARVVPRTITDLPEESNTSSEEDQSDKNDVVGSVGTSAKIPLPSIYLGLKRLAPIGEADEHEVMNEKYSIAQEDAKVMLDFINKVNIGGGVTSEFTLQSLKSANKKSAHPGYVGYESLAVSIGQDSLASIATAIASFNRLKRVMGESYPGGLLVIDELDAGLHPHAILRLATALKLYAGRLELQVIATTHSPTLITSIHPDGEGNSLSPDQVFYLVDTNNPRLVENSSLKEILNDLSMKDEETIPTNKKKPKLIAYLEDKEAVEFFNGIIPTNTLRKLKKNNGVDFKAVALGIGGSNLIKLPEYEPLFLDSLLIPDGDTTVRKTHSNRGNTLKLPVPKNSDDKSPERIIRKFLLELARPTKPEHSQWVLELKTTLPSSNKVETKFFPNGIDFQDQRDESKNWWTTHYPTLKAWGILELWASKHPRIMGAFIKQFEESFNHTAARLKNRLAKG